MKHFISALLAAAALFCAASAHAQFVFCKIEGQKQGIIKGDSTTKGLEDSIPVLSLASGVLRPFDAASGLPTGKRQHQPLALVKNLDKASPKLFIAAVTNENLKQVDCVFYRTLGTGEAQPYFRILLTNALIVELDVSGNGMVNQGMRETVRLTFQKIRIESLGSGGTVAEDDWETPVN
jgi:type VI secretion system secreted protein Hcp